MTPDADSSVPPRPGRRRFDGRTAAIALALIAFVTHLPIVLIFGDVNPWAQIWEYGHQAQCALETGGGLCLPYQDGRPGYYPSAYMPPLMSYLWYGAMLAFGDTAEARWAMLGLNLILSMANAVLVFILGRQLRLSVTAAFIGGLLITLYPTFMIIVATYHQTELTVFLALAVATLSARALRAERLTIDGALLLGAVSALAALNRTEMLLICPLLITIIAVWRRSMKTWIVAGATMALLMTPWVARNWVVFNEVIPVAQSSGYNVWKGFNPYSDGSGNSLEQRGSPGRAFIDSIYRQTPAGPMFERDLQANFEAELKAYLADAGPARLAQLTVNKLLMLWGFDWTDRTLTLRLEYLLPWSLANALVLLGAWVAFRSHPLDPRVLVVCAVMLVMMTAGFMATGIHARYRMHLEPFLFPLAGLGAEALIARLAGRRLSRPAPAQ